MSMEAEKQVGERAHVASAERTQREYLSFVRGFLEILDALDRWREGADEGTRRPLEIVQKQASRLLVRHGVRQTARLGGKLDLRYHEVVETTEVAGGEPDTILRVLQTGYEIVISPEEWLTLRPARVAVAAGAERGESMRKEEES